MENFSYLLDSHALWLVLWQVDSRSSMRCRYTEILARSYYIGLIHIGFWHVCNPLTISHLSCSLGNSQHRRFKGNKITIEERNFSFSLSLKVSEIDQMKGKKKARRISVKLHIYGGGEEETNVNAYKAQCKIEIGNFVFEVTILVTFIGTEFVTFTKLVRKWSQWWPAISRLYFLSPCTVHIQDVAGEICKPSGQRFLG